MSQSITVRFGGNLDDLKKAISEGKVLVKSTSDSIDKMVNKLSGSKAKAQADIWVRSLQEIGGAAKLTAEDQQKANKVMERAIAYYRAAGKEIPADIKRIADATKTAGKAHESLGASIAKTAAGFAAGMLTWQAASRGIHALTGFITSSVDAYAEQEKAVKKMTVALMAQGTATPATVKQYTALASSLQSLTTYGDEALIEMQALLTQIGNVGPRQMKAALTASTDLASGLGVDLKTATLLVGKAFAGETGTLKRYGIVIDETKLKTEGITAVLDAIQSKFGGQAQAEAQTVRGHDSADGECLGRPEGAGRRRVGHESDRHAHAPDRPRPAREHVADRRD